VAAAVLDVTPTRQSLSRSIGEPRLEASKVAAEPDDVEARVGLTWLPGLGKAAEEGVEEGGAAWATAVAAPKRIIKTAVKLLRRKVLSPSMFFTLLGGVCKLKRIRQSGIVEGVICRPVAMSGEDLNLPAEILLP